MSTLPQILKQRFFNNISSCISDVNETVAGCSPCAKKHSHYNATPPIISTPPTITPPSTNNTKDKFYPKDVLKEFFAEGQCSSLFMQNLPIRCRQKEIVACDFWHSPTLYQI